MIDLLKGFSNWGSELLDFESCLFCCEGFEEGYSMGDLQDS